MATKFGFYGDKKIDSPEIVREIEIIESITADDTNDGLVNIYLLVNR